MIEWLTDDTLPRDMSDRELLRAYQQTDGTGARAEMLLAQIEARELDI